MLQRKPAARITLEGIGRHPWLQGPHAPAPAPPPPPSPPPAEQPAKKARALDKLAAGLSSLRMSQSSNDSGDEAPVQPGCVSPRGGGLFKPPSMRRGDAAGAASPRQAPKWPRWLALNQGQGGGGAAAK